MTWDLNSLFDLIRLYSTVARPAWTTAVGCMYDNDDRRAFATRFREHVPHDEVTLILLEFYKVGIPAMIEYDRNNSISLIVFKREQDKFLWKKYGLRATLKCDHPFIVGQMLGYSMSRIHNMLLAKGLSTRKVTGLHLTDLDLISMEFQQMPR